MFVFIESICCSNIIFSGITLSATLLKCVSMNNQEFKVRPEIVDINSDDPVFYPFSIKISKCSGSGNNINIYMQKYVFLML